MGKQLAYYLGTIEAHKDGCYVGGQKIDCPKGGQSLFERPFLQSGVYEPGSSNLDILPPNPSLDIRNDLVFVSIFLAVGLSLLNRIGVHGFNHSPIRANWRIEKWRIPCPKTTLSCSF